LKALDRPVQQRADDWLGGLVACQRIKVALHCGGGLFPIHAQASDPTESRELSQAGFGMSTCRAKQGNASWIPTNDPPHSFRLESGHVPDSGLLDCARPVALEVRRGHTLLCCGTTHTRQSAEREAKQVSAA
jgi:hypothetical protein